MPKTSYQDLIEQIVQKQASVLGIAVAVRRARKVAGLEIDDQGAVGAVPANVIPVLEGLVEQYKALSGSMGVEFCKQAAAAARQAHPDMQLPSVLA
jgi:hypothetical protein